MLANCETVSEVVAEFEKHNLTFLANAMLMFGDQHGDSVIIEGDELLRINSDHQVVTNFYQSLTPAGNCPCPRYDAAIKALGDNGPISVAACRDVLKATRQNGRAPTQYSNVYDLKKGLVYLYHFHNFQEEVVLDLKEELKKGAHEIDLPSLFSESRQFVALDLNGEKAQNEIYPEAADLFFRIGDLGLESYQFRRDIDKEISGVTLKVFGRTFQGTKKE